MFKKISLSLCFLVWATALQSAPLTWVLNGVTFDDGGIATGSFVFDADTNTVPDWNISVSGGNESLFPAFVFTPVSAPNSSVVPNSVSGTTITFLIDDFALGGTPESRLIRLATDAPLTNAGGSVTLTNPPLFGSNECYNCNPFRTIVSGTLSVALPASPPICDIQLNQTTYIDGDLVTANVFRFANLSSTDIAAEIKIWLGVPGIAPISVTNVGADGSVVLPAGVDIDSGPISLFPVTGLPLGNYELSCRMLDPVTGELLVEDLNPFEIQTANTYAIGDTGPAGGIVFHVTDGGLHGLEAAPVDQQPPFPMPGVPWGCHGLTISGADGTAIGTGAQNTVDILSACSDLGIAARLADSYTLNGFTDWYLPSKDELNELYLQRALVGNFTSNGNGYWSSTEMFDVGAWFQDFDDGSMHILDRNGTTGVRAIRSF